MSVPQFCEYATDALIGLYQASSTVLKDRVTKSVLYIARDMEGKEIRAFRTPQSFPDIESEHIGEIRSGAGTPIEIRRTAFPQDLFNALDGKRQQEAAEDFMAALSDSRGATIRTYDQTPFVLKEGYVEIAKMYDVPSDQFSYFVLHILRGGFMGWGDSGIPDCAFENLKRLQAVVAGSS